MVMTAMFPKEGLIGLDFRCVLFFRGNFPPVKTVSNALHKNSPFSSVKSFTNTLYFMILWEIDSENTKSKGEICGFPMFLKVLYP